MLIFVVQDLVEQVYSSYRVSNLYTGFTVLMDLISLATTCVSCSMLRHIYIDYPPYLLSFHVSDHIIYVGPMVHSPVFILMITNHMKLFRTNHVQVFQTF